MSRTTNIQKAIYIMLVAFVASCTGEKKSEKDPEMLPDNIVEMRDDQIRLAEIKTGQVEMRSIYNTLKVNGIVSVAPQNLAAICAPLGGFVKSSNLLPGNSVSRGQLLAVIENQEFIQIEQNYLEAKNKLEFAEAEFKRHSQLYRDDVYSEQNLQQVTADYKNLKVEVAALEQKLSLIGINPSGLNENNITRSVSLVSPFTGFVKTVNVNIGRFVSPNDVLFEIINNDRLYIELTLFEKDVNKVAAGQKVRFYINNETEDHEAVISQTGRSVSADKTSKVYANVISKCKNILPGMYVYAIIETTGNKVTALPEEAIVSFDDKDYIFIYDKDKVEDGKAMTVYQIVEVRKGITEDGYTEVMLPGNFDVQNTRIVTKGAYNLLAAKKNAGEMAC
jgi:membrane fusion protein, heavy metal efflux system